MSNIGHHPTPGLASVAREQFWTAALATRWVWAAAVVFGGFVTFVMSDTAGQVSPPEFIPGIVAFPAAVLALLLSQALWRHEGPTQRAYLHSMPVARRFHQLIKNGAGWAWAMIG